MNTKGASATEGVWIVVCSSKQLGLGWQFEWAFAWMVVFFILTLVVALILRKPMGVEL